MGNNQTTLFVSVIVPVRNEDRYIRRCLESVLGQDYPPDLMEVLVVDNDSNDATLSIVNVLSQADPRISVFHKNSGTIASIRNYGWHHAQGDILAFLDGDSVVEPNWLKLGLDLLLSDRDISCVGFAAAPPTSSDSWVERTWFPISSSGKHHGTKVVTWVSSFNLILKRDYFERVKGFDESLVTCEDADLGNRLSAISKIIFSDRCRVSHLGTVRSISEFIRKELWRGQNSLRSLLQSENKTREVFSVIVPFFYFFLCFCALMLAVIAIFHRQVGNLLMAVLFILISVPVLLSLRAGIRGPFGLVNTTALYVVYLLSRGAAIVFGCR